jgi:hypothetical protein
MPRGHSALDEATIQGRLLTPAVLRPSIWISAADFSTLSTATGASSIANKGTAGGNAVQATAANQPSLRTTDGDRGPGYPYLDFDGVNDSLSLPVAAGTSVNQFMYLVAVCRPGPNTSAWKSTAYGTADGSLWVLRNASQWRFAGAGTVTDTAFRDGRQVGSLAFTAFSTGVAHNAPDVWGVFSRSLVGTSAAGVDFARNPTLIARGDGGSGTTTAATKLAELLALPSEIGLSGLQLVEGYGSWQHGLRLVPEHRFSNRPPLIGDW